jgi:hypothetical protein
VLRPVSGEARAAGNVRGYACYPLVPYSNRIANAQLAVRRSARTRSRATSATIRIRSMASAGSGPGASSAHDAASALLAFDHTAGRSDSAHGRGRFAQRSRSR